MSDRIPNSSKTSDTCMLLLETGPENVGGCKFMPNQGDGSAILMSDRIAVNFSTMEHVCLSLFLEVELGFIKLHITT